MPNLPGSGPDGQQGEISAHSPTGDRVPGIPSELGFPTLSLPSRKDEEDTAGCSNPHQPAGSLNKRPGQIRREGLSLSKSHLASTSALQGPTEYDTFCDWGGSIPSEQDVQVQRQTPAHPGSREGPTVVDITRQEFPDSITPTTSQAIHDHRVRCLQHGLGSTPRGNPDRGTVVKGRVPEPHQLPGAPCSIPSNPVLYEGEVRHNYTTEVGQHNCGVLHKQDGRDSLPTTLQSSSDHMRMDSATEFIPSGRTSPRGTKYSSRSGVQNCEGQVRLDAEPQYIQQNPVPDGALRDRPIRFPPHKTVTEVFQLETRPRGRGDRCLQPGLVNDAGICQPPMVSDTSMPVTGESSEGQIDHDHPPLEYSTMVPNHPGTPGGLPAATTLSRGSGYAPIRPGIHNESGSSRLSCMAHLRESFESRGISSQASDLLLSSWRSKTQSNYNSLFTKWTDWCHQWDRNPLVGPVEDVANFLANLYEKGYQYRSLNAYRSAISSVHAEVDGQPVGQHPLITRLLKGVFNERPPPPSQDILLSGILEWY